MLNDDQNPNISSVSGVLSTLGIAPQTGKYNVDKLLEIAYSRRIINQTLLSKATVSGKEDFLANHLINKLDLAERWQDQDDKFKGFLFSHDDQSSYTQLELSAMKKLYQAVVGPKVDRAKGLLRADYGNTHYIMSLYMTTPSDSLSIALVDQIYDEVSEFYVLKATESNQLVFDLIKEKRDSLQKQINTVAYNIAGISDRNAGSFRTSSSVEAALLEQELRGHQVLMEEIIKNLSRAEYALETSTPLIQLLDRPSFPLSPLKSPILRNLVLSLFAGVVLYLMWLYIRLVLARL